MYNEVLKYGSYIVDALVKYEQPIFIYIPPFGELRGGSWVVVDPTINENMMEMYADEDARGGVLEPEGIVGIKFRREKQLDVMARLDPIYSELRRRAASKDLSPIDQADIKVKMTERENRLLPVYGQISIQFADLHDRSGRMLAKGVIRQSLRWVHARRFFYWRLRRRLNEERFLKKMSEADHGSSRVENLQRLKSLVVDDENSTIFEENDRLVATWYEDNKVEVLTRAEGLRQEGVAVKVSELIIENGKSALRGVAIALGKMGAKEKEQALKMLAGPSPVE